MAFFVDKKINVLILISNYKLLKLSIMNTIFIFLVIAVLAVFVIAQIMFKKLQKQHLSAVESKSDIEQMVNAYRSGAQYKRARTRLWELIIIVPAIIALLGAGGYMLVKYHDNIRTSMPHFLEQDDEYYMQEFQAYKQTMVTNAKGWLEKDQKKLDELIKDYPYSWDRLIKDYPYSWVRRKYEEDVEKSKESLQQAENYSFETYIQGPSGKYSKFKLFLLVWFMFLVLQIVLYFVNLKQNSVVKNARKGMKVMSGIIFLIFLIHIIFGIFTWTEILVIICLGILSICL